MKRILLIAGLILLLPQPATAEEIKFFKSSQLTLEENKVYVQLNLYPYFFYNSDAKGEKDAELRERNGDEQLLGWVQRIALPPEGSCQRIEVKINLAYGTTDDYARRDLQYELHWEIYANSRLAAAGRIRPEKNIYILFIPEDIRDTRIDKWVIRDNGRLHIDKMADWLLQPAPENCLPTDDRLGDDGKKSEDDRQKNIDYIIAVKAVACRVSCPEEGEETYLGELEDQEIWEPVGESHAGWFSFTVVAAEDKKDEQPIKIFIRE
jgi:hypothetical protein